LNRTSTPRLLTVALPRDRILIELRADALTFETRECLLPGTKVRFRLVMEGRPLALQAPVGTCLVMDRDRVGYLYNVRLALDALAEPDRHLIALFIEKGRGGPALEPPGD
jgi:hypothetical protein